MHISLTPRALLRTALVWGLAAFFVIGGLGNIIAPPAIRADYARWGYPGWFHYCTGLLELAAAWLIAREATRHKGAIVGGVVMAAALLTLLINAEPLHAVAPVTVLLALFACLALDAKAREVRWECKVF
jgi:uncharacterized protein (DUF983 family)